MNNMVLIQLYSFIIYIVSGIIIGIFFDLFRILRRSFITSDIITYLQDIIFWLGSGFFLLFIIFKFNNGEVRFYIFIGLLLGGLIYLLTISKYFVKINVKIITFIKNLIYKIFKILFYPFKVIFIKPFTFLVININKKINFFGKKRKKPKKMLGKEGF